jgi:hypothetical protein
VDGGFADLVLLPIATRVSQLLGCVSGHRVATDRSE